MNYTLMHGKIPVAEIEFSKDAPFIIGIKKVFNPLHFPLGLKFDGNIPDTQSFNKWWRNRSIPQSRQDINYALQEMGEISTGELSIKCLGLSLSDQYWVNPIDKPLEWEKINFFDNSFSEDVGNILFGNPLQRKQLNLISPDNTSDGWLKKRWKIIDGQRYLIKGGSGIEKQEPFNEAIATKIMERLNVAHVPYAVILDKDTDTPYSICPNFLNSKTELVPAYNVVKSFGKHKDISHYQHFLNCCSELGIQNAQESFDKMLTIDYLIVNRDRHHGNFGIIRDSENLNCIGLAPIFDSGTSLWNDTNTEKILETNQVKSITFQCSHEEQIKLVKDFSWLDLSALKGIEDEFYAILSQSTHIDEKRISNICKAFSERVKSLETVKNRNITKSNTINNYLL